MRAWTRPVGKKDGWDRQIVKEVTLDVSDKLKVEIMDDWGMQPE